MQGSFFGFVPERKRADEIILTIAEQVCGVRVKATTVANLRHRLEEFKANLTLPDPNPPQNRHVTLWKN